MGRVDVLELIDQKVAAAGLSGGTSIGITQENLDGEVDLFIEIDCARLGQGLAITVEAQRDPGLKQETIPGSVTRTPFSTMPPGVQQLLMPYRDHKILSPGG